MLEFGDLLRRYRLEAGLTQEALAERAGLTVQAIGLLERGLRQTPRRDTVRMLADALDLAAAERAALAAAAAAARLRSSHPSGSIPDSVRAMGAATDGGAGGLAQQAEIELPTGMLAFLLTDIQDSTALWETHPAAMRTALAQHDALMARLLARHGGRQIKERGEGDSIFAVFPLVGDALRAACALQQAFTAEPWPTTLPPRVRMGLHVAEAERRDGSYEGVGINRAARLRGLAHGGQILLSQATADLLRDGLPQGVQLRALGPHRLRGLEQPEEVFQVECAGLQADFPPLTGALVAPTNLPEPLTSFIGREQEQAHVRRLLTGARLVTLSGSGGCGKTRLAMQVAGQLLAAFPDGVWLVELAQVGDDGQGTGTPLAGAMATTLGLRDDRGRPPLTTLVEYLKPRRLLLLLDNCEHLVGACAMLATTLLAACPSLRILATSREALAVAGETLYRVPSLSLPEAQRGLPGERLLDFEAVRLFLERARERQPGFELTERNAPAVVRICRRLDGIPLAIELAAARVGVLGVEQLAARLHDRFRLLTGGPRTVLPRQQTLQAALDWSYELLGELERTLLRRLTVFAGGWTLEAAEAVCAGGGIEQQDMLDLLDLLVHKSLAVMEEQDGQARYRLLETIREFGRAHLQAGGEAAMLQRAHLTYFLALVEGVESELRGPDQALWLIRLEREHDNLRAALRWANTAKERGHCLRLVGALWRFWYIRGYLGEGREWLERILQDEDSRNEETGAATARAKALHAAAVLAESQGDAGHAASRAEESLALYRALDDKAGIATTLNNRANIAGMQGEYRRAAALYEESMALWRDLGNEAGVATALNNLAMIARLWGEDGRARALSEESLALRRALGDKGGMAIALRNLGSVAINQGDVQRATRLCEESLALWQELGDRWGIADVLGNLALVAQVRGDTEHLLALAQESLALFQELDDKRGIARTLLPLARAAGEQGDSSRAAALYQESLALSRTMSDQIGIAAGLEGMARVACAQGQLGRAARLCGAAEALREAIGVPLSPPERAVHDHTVTVIRSAQGGDVWTAAWAAGRALPLEKALVDAESLSGPC